MEYRTQKILLTGNIDDETEAYLLWLVGQSNSLYNSVLYAIRQSHFEQCQTLTFFDSEDQYRTSFRSEFVKANYPQLCQQFQANKHYQALGGQQGQQCIKSVVEAIKSYNRLLKLWWSQELNNQPKIPGYRTSGGVYQVAFTNQNLTYDDVEGFCRLSISRIGKPELLNPEIIIPSGTDFKSEQLAEVRIIPRHRKLWAEYVYKVEPQVAQDLDYSQALGIDPGVSNWLTAISTQGI